ncbi:MAG: 6-phosphogluconolactonase [Candidatus Sedimenticola endophacoides]|uniref:6-phosphogluconolactonase n=1 Tax=Candidatus Sedimenticola endophacoides TaxID=2548426 RepID=A0A657PTW2_9GAMM|nr:MAG: 6-phosphogluconolactonase [Candidatus Sedimenticola endophacoides]OQX32494.1 MAG: 6-phosphogluconolactonase [Candidatus Sedimenticola endophacoides]OQX35408.1 MAG: 6-phosphogluconolactonase [Candidatus Sedimenticola endophacoides]OQX39697.1 MAG: 6-phosphogluconolactonase [Candidatus Sedimenticola endophacoides]OQX43519.1 MAG: 6-phosphogluconolactonase [Candidatus Sedimenticola endophacoides]
MSPLAWTLLDDAGAVAAAACERIARAADEAIALRGAFHLVLAGGATPRRAYEQLAGTTQAWHRWHLYFGDERCLPAIHPDRNSRMVECALTSRVPIPAGQIHPIPAERGADAAAGHYARTITAALPFDLVLLGIGEDGHTASLFPGRRFAETALVVAEHDAPKPPPERVSLNYPALNACRALLFLVTGAGKQQTVAQWRDGRSLPAAAIRPRGGGEVLVDREAAAQALPFRGS